MRISALILFAVLALGAAPAFAEPGVQPLDRILSHMRSERGGTFYDADGPFPDGRGGMHYRIKWLTPEGKLIWLDTDARTGRVLDGDHGHVRDEAPRDNHDNDSGRDHRNRFDNDRGARDDYNDAPRENFPRDPRWPRWPNGDPVGSGRWHDRDNGHWRDNNGHRGRHGE